MDDAPVVLYFEDDVSLAGLVIDYLSTQGFICHHYYEFPHNGIEQLKLDITQPVSVVLLDINMAGKSGYEICEILKADYLPNHVPVVFTSGLMQDEDILKAYAAGADDYLVKPIALQTLQVKLQQLIKHKQEYAESAEQISAAMKMAFDAMKNSSELGQILRFQEAVYTTPDMKSMARLLFDALAEFSLLGTFVVPAADGHDYFRDDEQRTQLELESILAARAKGRLYSWKQYSFFSYDLFTVLIRNMPIDDEERYGILKDQICLLLNGVDARIKAMRVAKSEAEKKNRLTSISKVLAGLVLEMEQGQTAFSERFETIISDMETNITAEIAQFNLLEHEEHALLEIVNDALSNATALMQESIANEQQRKVIMDNLLLKMVE